jgi:hypothetical protein
VDDLPDGDLKGCCGEEGGRGLSGITVPDLSPHPVPMARKRLGELETEPAFELPPMQPQQQVQYIQVPVPAQSSQFVARPLPRPRRPRSKGNGAFCVLSHKGNVVHCYHDEGKAKRVAKSFAARTGTKFLVRRR